MAPSQVFNHLIRGTIHICFLPSRCKGHFTFFPTGFCPSSALWRTFFLLSYGILSSSGSMKDISSDFLWRFVLHRLYEGHFLWFPLAFCPSSALWRTFPLHSFGVLSFISFMKDISSAFLKSFVLHRHYEGHSLCFPKEFWGCPESKWKLTFRLPLFWKDSILLECCFSFWTLTVPFRSSHLLSAGRKSSLLSYASGVSTFPLRPAGVKCLPLQSTLGLNLV